MFCGGRLKPFPMVSRRRFCAEPGFEDGGDLHIVFAVGQLFADLLIHVLHGNHCLMAGAVFRAQMGCYGNVAVGAADLPLAEKFCLLFSRLFRLKEAGF